MSTISAKFLDGPLKGETKVISDRLLWMAEYRVPLAPYILGGVGIVEGAELPDPPIYYTGVCRVVAERVGTLTYHGPQRYVEMQWMGIEGPVLKSKDRHPAQDGNTVATFVVDGLEIIIRRKES